MQQAKQNEVKRTALKTLLPRNWCLVQTGLKWQVLFHEKVNIYNS